MDEAEAKKEEASPRPSRKHKGKREEDLEGLPVIPVEHTMAEKNYGRFSGKKATKRLPDEIYRRYRFCAGARWRWKNTMWQYTRGRKAIG